MAAASKELAEEAQNTERVEVKEEKNGSPTKVIFLFQYSLV